MKILFICSGNICRSPMAAEYMRDRVAQAGLSHTVVDSAGTLGIEGAPASGEAIETLRENGLDLTGHRSRGIQPGDLRTSDVVLVMNDTHLDAVDRSILAPEASVYLLRAFEDGPEPSRGAPDLADPIGRDIDFYRKQFALIRNCVDHLVIHLRHQD